MQTFECYIKPLSGQILETTITLPPGNAALLTGFVHSTDQQPVEGTSVLLLEQETGKYVACCLTDSDGRFWLGPVPGDTLYIMKVTQPRMDIRMLELSV